MAAGANLHQDTNPLLLVRSNTAAGRMIPGSYADVFFRRTPSAFNRFYIFALYGTRMKLLKEGDRIVRLFEAAYPEL